MKKMLCPLAGSKEDCGSCDHAKTHKLNCFCTGEYSSMNNGCAGCVDVSKEVKELDTTDKENIIKAAQTANMLCNDLKALVSSSNLYLSDIGLELNEIVVKVENKLKRIASYEE